MRARCVLAVAGLLCLATIACGGSSPSAPSALPAAPQGPSITTASLPSAVRNEQYTQPVNAIGGQAPYAWTADGTLPSGVTFTSQGMFNGVPAEAGNWQITTNVTDAKGLKASKQFNFMVLMVPCTSERIDNEYATIEVLKKPCGLTLKVGTSSDDVPIEIRWSQKVFDIGYFVTSLSRAPIGSPDSLITPIDGDVGPWASLSSPPWGLAKGVTETTSFVERKLLYRTIPADQVGTLTYLLITLRSNYDLLGWFGPPNSNSGCYPTTVHCAAWQTKIVLNDTVIP
jgi:hypothetical protein